MPNLVKKIQNVAHEQNLWKRGDKIVLGVSGGPDSMCLLNIFSLLSKKQDLEIVVAHVNYGLRGKDSQKDQELVEKSARKNGFAFHLLETKLKNKQNLEEACRKIRYTFFEKILFQEKATSIAVAHNLDDQAETFLMRIIRGSGLLGLSAMKYRNNKLIRPLLSISRKEILEYLKENKLTYRLDKSNLESFFVRNKVRNKLIPFLEKNFNPNIRKTLFEASLSIAEDYDFILRNLENRKTEELSAKKLLSLPSSILKMTIRKELERKKGDLRDIQARHIEEILKILRSNKNKTQKITLKGLKIEKKGDKVSIVRL